MAEKFACFTLHIPHHSILLPGLVQQELTVKVRHKHYTCLDAHAHCIWDMKLIDVNCTCRFFRDRWPVLCEAHSPCPIHQEPPTGQRDIQWGCSTGHPVCGDHRQDECPEKAGPVTDHASGERTVVSCEKTVVSCTKTEGSDVQEYTPST